MALHIVSVRSYVIVFLCLIVLTIATAAVSYVDLGAFNNVVALGIAVIKATLVALVFMHLRFSTRMTAVAFTAGLFWLAIMISLTFSDVATRSWLLIPGR